MVRNEAIRKAVDGWFNFGCSVISERSGDITGDVGRLHDQVVEVCAALEIEPPEIPSYYGPFDNVCSHSDSARCDHPQ